MHSLPPACLLTSCSAELIPCVLTQAEQCPQADCLCFAEEDIKLNSTLLLWPDQIEDVFENSRNLLLNKRDQAEMDLMRRYGESPRLF